MGKRVRDRMDLLSGQTGAVAALGSVFFVCGLAGIILAGSKGENEYSEMKLWLTDAFRLVQEGRLEPFRSLLWARLRMILPVLILSTTPLGVPGIPALFGWLGFQLARPVACLFQMYGLSALYPVCALFGLMAVFWLPLLFWAGSRGLLSARNKLDRSGHSVTGTALWQIVCCVLTIVCVLIEYFAAPAMLRAAAQVIL